MMNLDSNFLPQPALTEHERRRRVVILCCSFMRNLAFHRAGMIREVQLGLLATSHPHGAFWRECHGNFFDMCVLEWCKLFVDVKGRHHWHMVVPDRNRFQADLSAALEVTDAEFSRHVAMTRRYRDKFVAHLDEERKMNLPHFEISEKAVRFLHTHIAPNSEADPKWFGLPKTAAQFAVGYEKCVKEAESVYCKALSSMQAM